MMPACGSANIRTVFSALSGTRLLACLIIAPQRGYDEPGILSYAISSFCPTSADGLQLPTTLSCFIEQSVSKNQKAARLLRAAFARQRWIAPNRHSAVGLLSPH